ncbi:MAG: hypothetical protein KGK44_11895 [Gammaproteobacteria bacterium]|nr:hypothetical protein [Gammaproteobacteria bacterium]
MFKFLGETPVPISCHACGKQQQKKLKWLRKNKTLKCKKCGKKIDLSKPEFRKTLKTVTQAIHDFEKSLDKLHASSPKKKSRKSPAKTAPRQVVAVPGLEPPSD